MNADGAGLWDEEDGLHFDRLTGEDGAPRVLRVHSIVGTVPLFGVLPPRKRESDVIPDFRNRMPSLTDHEPRLGQNAAPDARTCATILTGQVPHGGDCDAQKRVNGLI